MQTPEDALRSLRRWLGIVLPAPWDVRYQKTEEMGRPAAVVLPAIPQANTGSAYIRDVNQSYDLFVYPEGVEGDPAQSRQEAEQVKQTLDLAMTRGVKIDTAYYSYCLRIPVFDYAGLAWNEPQPDSAVPYDFYPVSLWSVDVRVDPDDDTLFTVLGSCRLSWKTFGDVRRFDGATLQDVQLTGP